MAKKEKSVIGFKMFKVDEDGKMYCQPGNEKFYYEVGKAYKHEGEISPCSSGFHFCEKLENCFNYYEAISWNKICKIKASGKILKENDKSTCEIIEILEEIPFNKISELIKGGVNGSYGVNRSDGVNGSDGVNRSDGVNGSDGVNRSNGVNYSYGVNGSDGVNYSYGVNGSDGVNSSNGVNGSDGVNYSYGVNRSNGVNDSYGVLNCFGVSHSLFITNKKPDYKIFNKKVSQEYFENAMDIFRSKLNGWNPTFNNLKSLYLKFGSEWKLTPIPLAEEISLEEAWKDMPVDAINYLKSLPEFNSKIFFEITGIKVKK